MKKTEILEYVAANELEIARAIAALAACDLVYSAYVNSEKVTGVKYGPVLGYFGQEGLTSSLYQIISRDNLTAPMAKIYVDFCQNQRKLNQLIDNHLEIETEIDKLGRDFLRIRNSVLQEEFLSYFNRLVELTTEWWKYGVVGEDKGLIIHDVFVPKFARKYHLSQAEANEVFNALSHPEEQTILNQERENFLKICLKMDNGGDYRAEIEEYEQNFFWFQTDFYKTTEFDQEVLLGRIQAELRVKGAEEFKSELAMIAAGFAKIRSKKQELRKKFALDAKDESDLLFAQRITAWIDLRKRGMSIGLYYFFLMLFDIARKFQIDYDKIVYYSIPEIQHLLSTSETVHDSEIERRSRGVFGIWQNGETQENYYNEDAKKLFDSCTKVDDISKVLGLVASTGGQKRLTGRVQVIHQPDETKFEDGNILVTSMTRVEFIPLMRRASAIITDEGGIACHAAIVSRELGLPCIIGTKNATRILKSGDVVEIDTTSGEIRRIKKA